MLKMKLRNRHAYIGKGVQIGYHYPSETESRAFGDGLRRRFYPNETLTDIKLTRILLFIISRGPVPSQTSPEAGSISSSPKAREREGVPCGLRHKTRFSITMSIHHGRPKAQARRTRAHLEFYITMWMLVCARMLLENLGSHDTQQHPE